MSLFRISELNESSPVEHKIFIKSKSESHNKRLSCAKQESLETRNRSQLKQL